jgi:excisionase family DNA binding protein
MTNEEKRKKLTGMLSKCPEVLTPIRASKWIPIGKNKIYELIHNGEIRSFVYRGGYLIVKEDLINYMVEHSDDQGGKYIKLGREVKKK